MDKQNSEQSYVRLNFQRLQKEFSDLDSNILKKGYFSPDKDCERARCALRAIAEREVEKTSAATNTIQETFLLERLRRDVFNCAADVSLCHCVSEDMEMGRGIAVEFEQVQELKSPAC